jgi:hypothetical protein
MKTLLAALAGALVAFSAGAQDLNFATGRQGGSQYPVVVAISQIIEKTPGFGKVSLLLGGGTGNVIAVGTGKAQLGITMSNDARSGFNGEKPYQTKMSDLVQLFALHPFKIVVIVPEDSPVKSFKDLAGKTVNTGPVGFTITTLSRKIYGMVGIEKNVKQSYLQVDDAVEQFKDGHLDALFYSPSDWYGAFIDLAQSRKIRLVPLPDKVMDDLIKEDPSFYKAKFPLQAGIYKNLSNSVETLAYPNIIVANKKEISDQQAYDIVKAVAEHWDQVVAVEPSLKLLKVSDLALQAGLPVHPGSLRYFRERGWVK